MFDKEEITRMQKFEKMINTIQEAKDISEELGEDLLSDALDNIIRDINEQYDDEFQT